MSLLQQEFEARARDRVAEARRRKAGLTIEDEAAGLSGALRSFVEASWHLVWPNQPFVPGWHFDAICAHLEAVSAGEIRRLQVWVPPGMTKSSIVSIAWPAWEWTRAPHLRYITASYDQDLSTALAVKSRDLIKSDWYQERWPGVMLRRDMDLKRSYANTAGGERFATSVGGGATGKHGHRVVIDDPLNAKEIASAAALEAVREWHDGTISTRFVDPKASSEVMIMQRLDERDLAGHLLDLNPGGWAVLCLPEEFEPAHPYAWRGEHLHPRVVGRLELTDPGRVKDGGPALAGGDPREEPGELLCKERVDEVAHAARVLDLGQHRAAGQLQQRPAAREGAILRRDAWKFFPRSWLEDGELHHLPRFSGLVQSWDTSFKDTSGADYVAGGLWGQSGADLYLLATRHERMGLSATKQAMRDMSALAGARWPAVPMRILIEKSANGVEIIEELKRELRGVTAVVASVSKQLRAEATEPALEGGNIWVPGMKDPDSPAGYNAATTPEFAQSLIEECAVFPNGAHDDQVDMFTQAVNWSRGRLGGPARVARSQRAIGGRALERTWAVHRGDINAGLG